jgi:hypothetical protein
MFYGVCSLCGGRVVKPEVWHGVFPPVPTCERCGARPKSYFPVIQMEQAAPQLQHVAYFDTKTLGWS